MFIEFRIDSAPIPVVEMRPWGLRGASHLSEVGFRTLNESDFP
jgi:hypothetical protein